MYAGRGVVTLSSFVDGLVTVHGVTPCLMSYGGGGGVAVHGVTQRSSSDSWAL